MRDRPQVQAVDELEVARVAREERKVVGRARRRRRRTPTVCCGRVGRDSRAQFDVVTAPPGAEAPSWVLALTDDQLRLAFGQATFGRGVDYARRGMVRQVDASEDAGEVSGVVNGTARRP